MNPAFGQPTFGQSTFGQPQFGSSANNAFAPGGNTNNTATGASPFGAPNFGSSNNTEQTSAFGQPTFGSNSGSSTTPAFGNNTSSPFGQAGTNPSPFAQAGSKPSPFGQQAGNSLFKAPAASPFGQNANTSSSNTSTTTQASAPQNASKPSPFGQTGITASPFGKTGTTASPFGQTGTTASPFGQTGTTASPFGQTGTTASPFGQTGTTASPFGQAGTTASPFGQTAKIEKSDAATPAGNTGASKLAIPSKPASGDAKPSIFGQTTNTEAKPSTSASSASSDAKPSIFGQANKTETKPSIFGQANKTDAKPSIFGQKSVETSSTTNNTNNALANDTANTDSLISLDKKLTLSPKKTAPRGLSGASPTKPKSSESEIISKIEKPVEPEKPQLTEKFLETLKTLSINKDVIKSGSAKPSSNVSVNKKDFKPVNLDISRGSFANTTVDESVRRVLSERKDKDLMQHDLDMFLFDQSGKKVMSKSYLHANGNAVYVNANNEILLIKKNETHKVNLKSKLKVEDFDNWQISYNGEDLLLYYYQKNNQSKIHIIDTKIKEVTTLKTKFDKGIKKLTWHPLANTSVLVFMTDDNLLYQLNVWTGQLLHISKRILGFYDHEGKDSLRNVFDSLESDNDFELSNITSFELSDDGWKLYLVDSVENNVYIICPFVPLSNRMTTTHDILDGVREEISWMMNEYNLEEKVDEYVFKDVQDIYEYKDWVSSGNNKGEHEIISREVPEDWCLNMGVQGPITFSHFPERLYEHSLVDVKCISNTHSVLRQMLVLLYSNGETAVVFNTFDPVIFRNNWKTLVLNLYDIHKFVLIDSQTDNSIAQFLPGNIDEGCLALTKNNEVVFLNYLDVFCRCESVYFHNAEETIYNKPSNNPPLLKLNNDYGEIFLLNNKDVIYYDEPNHKLKRVLYPSFLNVQGREFSLEFDEFAALKSSLDEMILHEEGDADESDKPKTSTSTSCVNIYFDLLDKFEEEINNLKSFNNLNKEPLLTFSEDDPEKLLSSMQDFGNPISKALSLSYSLQTWMRTCLNEFKETLDDNIQSRLIDANEINDMVESITKIRTRYETQLNEWEQRLTRLQSIKKKVAETEKLALTNENIDTSVLENYKATVDIKTIETKKIMEHIEDVKKDIEFLSMKLSDDVCKTANTNGEGIDNKNG
ncbi:hypothetical protein ACO0OL_002159 [Hanseniaspora opuntiae]